MNDYVTEMLNIASRFGYKLDDEDITIIMETEFDGDTPASAVIEYLKSYETISHQMGA